MLGTQTISGVLPSTTLSCPHLFRSQEAVQLLLGHGSNVKAAAMDDMNALHFAAQKGHVEPIRHLINAGKRMKQQQSRLSAVSYQLCL